jgi:BASS family bile acid:Na+ symporter
VESSALIEVGAGLFVVTMMVSVGLELTLASLSAVLHRPRRLLRAAAVNYLGVVAIAWLVVQAFALPTAVAAGLMLAAMAPGGPVGAALVQRAHGHLALAVSLVVGLNLANTLVMPALAGLFEMVPPGASSVPIFGMIKTIMLFQMVPLFGALAFREWAPSQAVRLRPWVEKVANLLLVALVALVAALEGESMGTLPLEVVPALICTVAGSLILGWWGTRGPRADRVAVTLVTGIRSVSLVLLVVASWYPDPQTLFTALGYSVIMFTMSVLVATGFRVRQGEVR